MRHLCCSPCICNPLENDLIWEEDDEGKVTILKTFLGTVSGAKHYRLDIWYRKSCASAIWV